MFTGIIEAIATVEQIDHQGTNKRFVLSSPLVNDLQIDQSVAHDGVCLTVVELTDNSYTVDVIEESLQRSTLDQWTVGQKVNCERSMSVEKLFDGHIVQGHVDGKVTCINKVNMDGSYWFTFGYPREYYSLLIPKGSVCINGVSLTIAALTDDSFSVAIIPYTYQHTNFHALEQGLQVNIEFDVIGKYLNRIYQARH